MSYLIYAAEYINERVDKHGQPEDCRIEKCVTCDEIIKMRKSLDKKAAGHERKSNKKITYLVTNLKTGESKDFLTIREICEYLDVGRGVVQRRLATQKVVDNIKIERIIKKNGV